MFAQQLSHFEQGGIVSEAGLARLKIFLSEVPTDRFKSPLKSAEIPKLFTVETFCKMVIRQQKAVAAAPKAVQRFGGKGAPVLARPVTNLGLQSRPSIKK